VTWVRHRPKGLSWALLLAVVLIFVTSVTRYAGGEVAPAEDLPGVLLRAVVLLLLVATYLRSGGRTTVDPDGVEVHDGLRGTRVDRAQVARVEEDPRRRGVVLVLSSGRRRELPGVPADDLAQVRTLLRSR
jgi:hypothetical protein